MSETRWTPGPWIIDPEENWIVTEWRSTEHGLQVLICDMMDEEAPQYEANAHLIAAAPELYEALKDVLRSARKDFGPGLKGETQFRDAYREAFAALAKARGEA